MSHSRTLLLLLGVFALALGLRLAVAERFQGLGSPPDAEANPDQVEYELFAWQLARGAGYTRLTGEPTAARPPGTSFALAPIYRAFGHSYRAGRLWFALLSATTCVLTAALAWSCFGPGPGVLAGLWLAFYPGHFYYSMHFLSEVVFGFFLMAALLIGRAALKRGSWKLNAVTGLLFGMAVLTRPQALLLPLCGALFALFSRDRRRLLTGFAVQLGVLAIAVAPWAIRNHVVLGKATLTTIGGYTFWGANNEVVLDDPALIGHWIPVDDLIDADHPVGGDEVEREAATWGHGLRFVREHRGEMPRLAGMKLWRLLSPTHRTPNRAVRLTFAAAWIVTGPLMLMGLLLAFRRSMFAGLLLLAPLAVTTATAVIFYGSVRFRDSVAPVFAIPAALAAFECWRWWMRRRRAVREG